MSCLEDLLAASPWARALTEEEQARVRENLTLREFAAGACVCRKGEPASFWIGVVEGLVKINAFANTGKSVTFGGVPAGGWVGEGSVLKGEPRKYDVVALRHSKIAFLPKATFDWLLDHSIPFNRFLLTQLNERLAYFIGMIEHERLLEPDARVARSLAALFNPQLFPGTPPALQISQEELGFLAGVSRQRVNQALQVLEAEGLVKVEYRAIHVLDLEGLRRFGA